MSIRLVVSGYSIQIRFCITFGETSLIKVIFMARNYSSPRYKNKSRPGRKYLDQEKRRKLITARIAPDAYKYLMERDMKIGLLIDQLVRKEMLVHRKTGSIENGIVEENKKDSYGKQKNGLCETLDFDASQFLT